MPPSQLTPDQIKLLLEVVREDGVYMTEQNEADARRLDDLILVELDWEDGICEILPYDCGRVIAATLAATPVIVAALDAPVPMSGDVSAEAFRCTNPAHSDDCRLLCTDEDALHVSSLGIPLGPGRLTFTPIQEEVDRA